jgi:ferredoxin
MQLLIAQRRCRGHRMDDHTSKVADAVKVCPESAVSVAVTEEESR